MNTAELINDHFHFDVVESGGRCHINLIGMIDENTNLNNLLKYKGQTLVFNFKKVTSINSCGIRTWVNFIKELGTSNMEFTECPPGIVRQMNMVPSFLGSAKVTSVYVPYVCDSCEHELDQLVQIQDYKSGKPIEETIKCEKCSSEEMEIDGNVKQYFAFVK